MGYNIGSFNLFNIGFSSLSKNNSRNLSKIASIIKNEDFDVIAFQEVLNQGTSFTKMTPDGFKKSILYELGPSMYDFYWADAKSEGDSRGEGYAFLWKKNRLRLVTTETDNGTRLFEPRMLAKTNGIIRAPYYARFTPQGLPGGTNFELRLICIHNYYGHQKTEDVKRRRQELDILLKDVYPRWSKQVYKDDMPHYTILLGDYNLELRRPYRKGYVIETDENDIVVSDKYDKMKIQTVQDKETSISVYNEIYSSNYDHFSFDYDAFRDIKKQYDAIDCVLKYCSGNFSEYYSEVSDHIPVMMSIDLK